MKSRIPKRLNQILPPNPSRPPRNTVKIEIEVSEETVREPERKDRGKLRVLGKKYPPRAWTAASRKR
eukprot:1024352-Amorphochlora_amoeboformis.AAC.1